MALTVSITGFAASSAFSADINDRERLPEEQLEILFNYPEAEKSLRLLKTCWDTISGHTASFRKQSARVADALSKCFSHLELDIYGISQLGSASNFIKTRPVLAQILFSNIHKKLDKYSWHMKLTYDKCQLGEGAVGSYTLVLSPDALSALTKIEAWDIVDNLIHYATDRPLQNVPETMRLLLSGISVVKVA